MSVFGPSRSHFGHQRFCWMRVRHSPWSWLKLSVAAVSVAGNTLIGMLTRLILRYPFHVGRAGMLGFSPIASVFDRCDLLVDLHLELAEAADRKSTRLNSSHIPL